MSAAVEVEAERGEALVRPRFKVQTRQLGLIAPGLEIRLDNSARLLEATRNRFALVAASGGLAHLDVLVVDTTGSCHHQQRPSLRHRGYAAAKAQRGSAHFVYAANWSLDVKGSLDTAPQKDTKRPVVALRIDRHDSVAAPQPQVAVFQYKDTYQRLQLNLDKATVITVKAWGLAAVRAALQAAERRHRPSSSS